MYFVKTKVFALFKSVDFVNLFEWVCVLHLPFTIV